MENNIIFNTKTNTVETKQKGRLLDTVEFKEHSNLPGLLIPESVPEDAQDLFQQEYINQPYNRTQTDPALLAQAFYNFYKGHGIGYTTFFNPYSFYPQGEEHPPEKIAQAEQYLKECSSDFTPTMNVLRIIEQAGFYEINEDKLADDIKELSDYPRYQFELKCISYNDEREQFDTEIKTAPKKVHKRFKLAQDMGLFEDFEIFKVKKVPDPILVGHYKGMQFEISRWT